MKIKTGRAKKQEITHALAVLAPDGQGSQDEETNSATPEEMAEFYSDNNPPVKLRDIFSLTFS